MAKKDKDGNWIDARGKAVPMEYVPELDQLRDAMVERVMKKALKLEELLLQAKLDIIAEVDAYLDAKAKAGKVKETWKGNITLDSFDGTMRVERSMDDQIGFSEQLQMVKTIIDEWIAQRLQGVDESLAKVIGQAFSVDKKGRVNTAMIMRLLNLDIEDAKWKKAMKLLRESIQVTATRQYLRFSEKIEAESGETWRQVCLNFSSLTTGSEA